MVAMCTCGNINRRIMYLLSGWWSGKKFFVGVNHNVCYEYLLCNFLVFEYCVLKVGYC